MKRVFKTKTFDKWLKKSEVSNDMLCDAVDEIVQGIVDADLGNGLYKKRIATGNRGKSAGARTLLATNLGNKWFFIYGFAKSQKSNINQSEQQVLKKYAEDLLNLTDKQINEMTKTAKLLEICNE